ncbi:MAG: peptide-methionine (S)-S-oxide reductase MsrA [bacterium]
MLTRALIALALVFPVACQAKDLTQAPPVPPDAKLEGGLQLATFAGGCFWCMEGPFEKLDGVIAVVSGFTDGPEPNPTYSQVSSGTTGHTEAIQVTFDPKKISYEKLVETFWHNIDPPVENRQFCDGGTQYRTGLFVHDAAQRVVAEASLAKVKAQLKAPIVTPIKAATTFYPAENYHQDFYKTNPDHYQRYRLGCGRDARLREIWGEAASH